MSSSTLEPKLGRFFYITNLNQTVISRVGRIAKRHRNGWFTVETIDELTNEVVSFDNIHISAMQDGNWHFFNFYDDLQSALDCFWEDRKHGLSPKAYADCHLLLEAADSNSTVKGGA
jgi:hypothetical protein